MNADADDAEAGQGAAIQHGEDRAVMGCADVEIFVADADAERRAQGR